MAYQWIDRVPADDLADALEAIFYQEADEVSLRTGDGWISLYEVSPEARERAAGVGHEARLLDFARERNRRDWEEFAEWVEGLGARMDDVTPVEPPPPEEDANR